MVEDPHGHDAVRVRLAPVRRRRPSTASRVKFYLVAMLFILFDIEAAFLIPWAVTFKGFAANKAFVLGEMAVFLGILVAGYVYLLVARRPGVGVSAVADGAQAIELLTARFPDAVIESGSFREQHWAVIDRNRWLEVAGWLRDDPRTRLRRAPRRHRGPLASSTSPPMEIVAHLYSPSRATTDCA